VSYLVPGQTTCKICEEADLQDSPECHNCKRLFEPNGTSCCSAECLEALRAKMEKQPATQGVPKSVAILTMDELNYLKDLYSKRSQTVERFKSLETEVGILNSYHNENKLAQLSRKLTNLEEAVNQLKGTIDAIRKTSIPEQPTEPSTRLSDLEDFVREVGKCFIKYQNQNLPPNLLIADIWSSYHRVRNP
jgi:hypothetical protein